jgi:hypothetical protein
MLDRQHGQVGVARQHGAGRLAERPVPGQVALEAAAGQVLLRRGVAVGVGHALERDADAAAGVAVQEPGLLGHRVVDQLAEDAADQAAGDAEVGRRGGDPVENLPLPVGVLDPGGRPLLGRPDRVDDAVPLGDQADNPGVHLVQVLAEPRDVRPLPVHVLMPPVSARRSGPGKGCAVSRRGWRETARWRDAALRQGRP